MNLRILAVSAFALFSAAGQAEVLQSSVSGFTVSNTAQTSAIAAQRLL